MITVVHSSTDEHALQESTTKAIAYLSRLQLQGKIMHILYESLLAEQSARFLSMDAATRNAEEALLHAQREYNTARQARVTQELLELTIGSQESLQENLY
jgi:F-type H+-transporting ATPase subunit gamma